MAFPWKTLGKYALLLGEYALSEREKRKAETPPVVPVVPPPVPDVVVAPPPVLTLEQRFGDAVRSIYAEILRRMPDAMELWEGMKLLEAGREDALRQNLKSRAGT